MPFGNRSGTNCKFENDEVAQHYFEVLRTLISKNPFCSTSRSQGSGQLFGEILQLQEPKSKLMIATQPLCDCKIFLAKSRSQNHHFL